MTTLTLPPPTFAPVPPPPAAKSARPKSKAIKVLVTLSVLALALSAFMIASLALFTDVENVGGNTFSTGNIDLAAAPISAVVTAAAMAPGDQVTATLAMSNSGSLDLRYSATSTTTEDVLAAELVLTIKELVTTCDDANWTTDGNILYTGVLGTTGTSIVFGNATPGADAGDRTLAPAASENLCVNVSLPLATTTGEGLTTTATLNFAAEQTANNP
ncbi:MAG: hypothetical protein HKN44_05745 [Ilumatobacter sp.]|nr:hypothetical protein [Ilumatobacter sp.]